MGEGVNGAEIWTDFQNTIISSALGVEKNRCRIAPYIPYFCVFIAFLAHFFKKSWRIPKNGDTGEIVSKFYSEVPYLVRKRLQNFVIGKIQNPTISSAYGFQNSIISSAEGPPMIFTHKSASYHHSGLLTTFQGSFHLMTPWRGKSCRVLGRAAIAIFFIANYLNWYPRHF